MTQSDHKQPIIVAYENPVLVLNDQGGAVMSVSDKANCLRAQDHGHPPVICLEGNGARPSHQGGVQRRREDVHFEHD